VNLEEVFDNETWAVGLEPVLRGTSCVCWRAVLLEDVALSTGQKSSAVVDKTGKKTANVVRRIHFSALVNKVESSLATKHTPSETITSHAQPEDVRLDVSFLDARPDSVVLVAVLLFTNTTSRH